MTHSRTKAVRRATAWTLAALTASVAAAGTAGAETAEPTRQATAAHAGFLEGLGPGAAAAVCMVDTGVDDVPDATQVVDRLTLDAGDGRDVSADGHGTQVAVLMGGGRNGWGTVGLWPAVRIVSVQASGNSASYTNSGFIRAVERCTNVAPTYGIKVITLALGGPDDLGDRERELFADDLRNAHAAGINVIASAGNSGGELTYPGSAPGVLSVGATDGQGLLCSFSSRPARLNAPGCDLDGADLATGASATVQGTSYSVSLVAAALAALRSSRPDVTWDQAESLLTDNASLTADGANINVEQAFRTAGIPVGAPAPTVPMQTGPTQTSPTPTSTVETPRPDLTLNTPRLREPRLSVRRTKTRLTVRVLNRPAGARVRLRFYVGERRRLTRVVRGEISLPRRRYTRVTAAFVTSSGISASSSRKLRR